ncbi:MAG TPA: DUF6655 family protein [Dongiaceae bacterium]|nr:DUF6655 family protein [Dongiaceae bacterium]
MFARPASLRLVPAGLAALVAGLVLSACTTIRSTDPQRTAVEQLLISTAADHAAQLLSLNIPKNNLVFVDAANFEGYDSKYAIGAIRDHILQQGFRLTDDKGKADTIVEISAGALSVDDRSFLIGIPQMNVPIPLAGQFSLPELALYKRQTQQGIAKFAATAFDAKQGSFVASSRPDPASSYRKTTTVLFIISWGKDDLRRPDD